MTKPMFWDEHYNNAVNIKITFYKQIKLNATTYKIQSAYMRTSEEQQTKTVKRHLHFNIGNEMFNLTLQANIKSGYMKSVTIRQL
jgi:hypothetical protein